MNSDLLPLNPGATLGVLGGGQLGRMFAVEALRMGYSVWVLDPDANSPAGAVATRHLCSSFTDSAALAEMAGGCDAITIEFENIPSDSVRTLSAGTRVTPSADCIEVAQDRLREKNFMLDLGLDTAVFAPVLKADDVAAAARKVAFPAILKTARLGYDGKGQYVCKTLSDVDKGFADVKQVPCILEQRVELKREISVVLCRTDKGVVSSFPVAENTHVNGILDTSVVPADISPEMESRAATMATTIADALGYIGVLAVELFVDAGDRLLVNEIAPRPHNSGHYTLDATATSQFEQQVRMLCGLPAGSARLLSPVVMLNLLGDRWLPEDPAWDRVYESPGNKLHLYGKAEARAGRKMGHINVLDDNRDLARERASKLNRQL